MLGQVISLILLALGLAIVAWAIWGPSPRKALRRKLRKGIAKTERNTVLPRSNGQGSRYGNRRIFRGKTRKPRPAPPEANGHKGRS
jgi:hypothetical protein